MSQIMDEQAFEKSLLEIRADRQRGASELACLCLDLLARSAETAPAADSSELLSTLINRCINLIACRPSMAPIHNLLTEWSSSLTQLDISSLPLLRNSSANLAREGIIQSKQAIERVAENAAEYIGDGKTVITHSISSTVLGVLERLKDRGVSVIATESRPLNEGLILVRKLSEWGIPTQLITDAQLGLFAARADVALLGADSLLTDGSAINKAGSYLLALAAWHQGVPLNVCCESFKLREEEVWELELEEMDASELDAPSLPEVEVRNIYFDITPTGLIGRWIDENGVHQCYPPDRSGRETGE